MLNLESIFRRPRNQHEGDIIISVQSLEAMYQQVRSYLLASSAYNSLMQNDYISQGYVEVCLAVFLISSRFSLLCPTFFIAVCQRMLWCVQFIHI